MRIFWRTSSWPPFLTRSEHLNIVTPFPPPLFYAKPRFWHTDTAKGGRFFKSSAIVTARAQVSKRWEEEATKEKWALDALLWRSGQLRQLVRQSAPISCSGDNRAAAPQAALVPANKHTQFWKHFLVKNTLNFNWVLLDNWGNEKVTISRCKEARQNIWPVSTCAEDQRLLWLISSKLFSYTCSGGKYIWVLEEKPPLCTYRRRICNSWLSKNQETFKRKVRQRQNISNSLSNNLCGALSDRFF